ncbi:MAG: glycosyltransferase [Clostridia bacterium]|nr:glycosyltransferase [Clostridia bacterium]
MRIVLLNDSFPPVIDGVANVVVNYAAILTKHGHDVVVATPDVPGAKDDYPFPVVRYTSLNTTKLVGYRAGYPFSAPALGELKDFKPDIIHSHCPVASNLLGRTLREQTGAPLIFTYHTKFDIDIRTAVKGRLLQNELITALVRNIQPCDEVWTVSHGAGENLRSIGYQGAYSVMDNGVDMPQKRAEQAQIDLISRRYGLRDDQPVFLFAGRLRWYKGIRHIIEGLAQAQRAGADFRMIFVGDGSDREAIEKLCRQAYIDSRCVFVGAVQDRELLRAFYSRADLFLFPSTFDTNGIVVREAAACGLGALLVRGSCAAEGVTDGQNGLLMAENGEELCRQVLFACKNLDVVRQIGRNAQQQLYLSWEDAVSRAEVRYAEIAKEYATAQRKPRRDLIPLVADWVGAVNYMRDISTQVIDLLR